MKPAHGGSFYVPIVRVPPVAQILFDRGGVLGDLAGLEDLRRRDTLSVPFEVERRLNKYSQLWRTFIGANSARLDLQPEPSKNHATRKMAEVPPQH